jgi:RsiW-degrading membrane proteinase PrsW (M82 family)
MLRYSLLRIMLLFGCMLVLWLVGAWLPPLRDPVWLILATAVTSVTLSYFVLRGPREELARQLAQRVEDRTRRRRTDADIEDEELDRQLGEDPPAR